MRVVKGLRWLIKMVIADCIKCKLMEKKTLELRLENHPEARTVLAPCFHSCMMDICYCFKGQPFKRSRTVIKIYGLVNACLLSGGSKYYGIYKVLKRRMYVLLWRDTHTDMEFLDLST